MVITPTETQKKQIGTKYNLTLFDRTREKMSRKTDQELISIGEVTVPFYEDRLIVQLGEDGEIYVALRPVVEALGLDWAGQYQRIKRDPVLSEETKTISVGVTPMQMQRKRGEGAKRYVCLPKQYLSGFLFGINANRVRKELREPIIKWQREFKAVWPGVVTMHLQTISDVDAFFAERSRSNGRSVVGVLKQTTARSASGWEHAYDYGGSASHSYGSKGFLT